MNNLILSQEVEIRFAFARYAVGVIEFSLPGKVLVGRPNPSMKSGQATNYAQYTKKQKIRQAAGAAAAAGGFLEIL